MGSDGAMERRTRHLPSLLDGLASLGHLIGGWFVSEA